MRNPLPWRYEPSGDSDGELVGTDHFVLDADGNEIACPPCEETAVLMVKGANAYASLTLACDKVASWLEQRAAYHAASGRHHEASILMHQVGILRDAVTKAKE